MQKYISFPPLAGISKIINLNNIFALLWKSIMHLPLEYSLTRHKKTRIFLELIDTYKHYFIHAKMKIFSREETNMWARADIFIR